MTDKYVQIPYEQARAMHKMGATIMIRDNHPQHGKRLLQGVNSLFANIDGGSVTLERLAWIDFFVWGSDD